MHLSEQMERAGSLRRRREALVAELTVSLGAPPDASLQDLLPAMPAATRPLFEALIEGAGGMLEKIQRKTRHNRMLLSRAGELTEQIMLRLQPSGASKTYNRRGAAAFKTAMRGGGLNFRA